MFEFISELQPQVLYPFIYFGIIFTGGLTLLPAMLYALSGKLSMIIVFFLSVVAGLTADVLWYFAGKYSKKERLYSFPFIRKRVEEAKHFSLFFEKHGVLLVFVTKFVWGTRIASHVLAGMHSINLFKFIGSTALGTTLWFLLFYVLLTSLDAGIEAVEATALRIQIICFVCIIVALVLNWFTGTYVRRRMMRK